jgi:hypothetical protein
MYDAEFIALIERVHVKWYSTEVMLHVIVWPMRNYATRTRVQRIIIIVTLYTGHSLAVFDLRQLSVNTD